MTNYSRDITKKHFLRQLIIPPHKQTLLSNTYMEEKYFRYTEEKFWTFFLRRNMFLKKGASH